MKIPTLFAAWTALVIIAMSLESKGQEPDFKPPGTEENAQWTRPIHALTQSINV
jgi:hypothetical protein